MTSQCELCNKQRPLQTVDFVGQVCIECLVKLEQPMTLEGLIPSASIRALSEALRLEMEHRGDRLKRMAKMLIEGE